MSLAALVEEFLAEHCADEPVHASSLGVPGHDHRLGEFGAADFEDRRRRDAAWLERFEALEEVDGDDAIDRDLVRSVLRGRAAVHDWEEWRRSADAYLSPALYGPFVLFLKRTAPDPELVDAAVARLAEVPGVLDAARANLDPGRADPMLVRRSVGMCQAGALYCREFLPAEVPDAALSARLADAGRRAAAAFEEFGAWLGELAERCTGTYAIGAERYSRILTEQEGLPWDASTLRERGRAALEELEADMARRARDLEGTDDFRAVVAKLNEDHPSSPDEMRREYEEATAAARAFLAERDLVSFPAGERCEVVPSPPFQRPMLAVASYSQPPAFTESRVGHFFVPYPPDGTPEEDVQRRLAMNSRALIPSIAVHEAYPGHHWHLSVAAGNPRPARKVFGSSYFAEGWGLYTEQMMREQGFFSPREELLQLDMRLFRAARIVVDTSLHIGDMTVDEAVAFMSQRAGLTAPVAQAEVARYCAWPTQAASYLTGSLFIEDLRHRYLEQGRGDLKAFHDTIAASGTLPLHLAERAVMGAP